MRREADNITSFAVTKTMCKKIKIINPGDIVIVNTKAKKRTGDLVLVFDNEKNWIDRYSKKLEKANAYLITKVIMNS